MKNKIHDILYIYCQNGKAGTIKYFFTYFLIFLNQGQDVFELLNLSGYKIVLIGYNNCDVILKFNVNSFYCHVFL